MKPFTLCAITCLLTISVTSCASAPRGQVAKEPVREESVSERWGVEVKGVRLSAAGHMLDFRYQVLDPVKAAPLFVRKTHPYLVDLATGRSLTVPAPAKTGPLRSSNTPQAGRTYFMFFGNAGKLVQSGEKVTVVIGDFRAENLTVE